MQRFTLSRLLFLTILFFSLISFVPGGNKDIADDVLAYTNQFRKANGLKQLKGNEVLDAIAQKHSENMAAGKVKFGHDGFAQRNAAAQKKISSIKSFAENVAFGINSGKEAVDLWKNSAGHRKNMLGYFTQIGIGVAKDKQGRIFYTQVFSD